MPDLAPGSLFMLNQSVAFKIIYDRPVGGPQNASNIGRNPNINKFVLTPQNLTLPAPWIFSLKLFMAHFSALIVDLELREFSQIERERYERAQEAPYTRPVDEFYNNYGV